MDIRIAVPAYNQPHLLRHLLDSLIPQKEYVKCIYIFDDCSTLNYDSLLTTYDDLPIVYSRNTYNLGAMPNMQYAFKSLSSIAGTDYIMVAHEDDVLASGFFKTIKEALTKYSKKPALILSYFIDLDISKDFAFGESEKGENFIWINKKELVNLFVQQAPVAFGSAIYYTKKYPDFSFDYKKYGEFADRPFLLDFLDDNDDVLLLTKNYYYLRSHEDNDTRWKMLRPRHINNLISLYWNTAKGDSKKEKRELRKYLSGFYADSYNNLKLSGNTQGWLYYALLNVLKGRISLKYLLLKQKHINRFFTWVLGSN